jgi:phosphoribosyl 1,2-cyclic phosphodiesterase
MKIFIIDDDESMLELQSALLAEAGHEVLSSSQSGGALEQIKASKPDCVITDIMMPEIDGIQILKQIRDDENMADMKVIIVSSKSFEFDRRQAMKLGAAGFITKPINPETYISQVDSAFSDQIDMTFWGVRGTLPVPGPRAYKYGGNTSCVTLEFSKGEFFIFDAGSGIKELSNHLLATRAGKLNAKIFISHPHWDHINALPFFAPLYIPGNEFEVLGASHAGVSMRELISAQMDDVYFPITMKEFGSRVYFRDLTQGEYEVDGISVKTFLLSHPGNCLGYRVDYNGRSICYVTDNEYFLPDSPQHNPNYVEKLGAFIEGTDALITDCTYLDDEYPSKVGWGHSCVSQVVEAAHQAKVQNLYLFHHDPDQDDTKIDEKFSQSKAVIEKLGSSTVVLAPAETDKVTI